MLEVDGFPGCLPLVWLCSIGLRTVISGSLLDSWRQRQLKPSGWKQETNPSAAFETVQPPLHWKGRSDSTWRPTRGLLRRIQGLPGDLREALMDDQRVRRSLGMWVGSWIPSDDSPYLLPHLSLGSGERGVGVSLCSSEVAAAQMILQQGIL
jgi:hypothetical protein